MKGGGSLPSADHFHSSLMLSRFLDEINFNQSRTLLYVLPCNTSDPYQQWSFRFCRGDRAAGAIVESFCHDVYCIILT